MNPILRSHISDSFIKAAFLRVNILGIVLINTYIYRKIKCYTAIKVKLLPGGRMPSLKIY